MYDCPRHHALFAHKFTGKERDGESGLDNFGARYDSSFIGRFMSPDPLMASATVRDPQTWNRYTYALNNPLKYVDPTGMTEENAADCQKDKKCVTVKVNVIYDQKANLTDKQKEAFNKQLLQEAKDEYGDAHIHLDVTYTAGGYDDKGNIQGVSKDSLNVIVSDWVPGGTTAVSQVNDQGYALTQININTAGKGDLAHEFAHDFLGDTTGLISRISKHDDSGIIGAVGNAIFDIVNDGMREAMKNPSPYVRSSMVSPEIFNSGAKQFQQMLTQQAAIRPRQ